jgi:hypothetical protein
MSRNTELGNVTVKNPTCDSLLNPWPSPDIAMTYLQIYTPFTKAFADMPFRDHPFLLTLMLGKEYVKRSKTFTQFFESTERDRDFLALKEAITLHLQKASSQCLQVSVSPP